jgi:hypothetical protein
MMSKLKKQKKYSKNKDIVATFNILNQFDKYKVWDKIKGW